MCIITQWIRKRRKQRQLLEERKKLEAERQIQREKQDYEYGQALQLILHTLQRTMHPLIASQAYNNRFCLLTRLPEELLLNVLDFLRGDGVTLCCLRITSRVFLRLLHNQSTFWTLRSNDGILLPPGQGLMLRFRRLLQRDERCDNCRRWNNAHVRFSIDPCKFKGSRLRRTPKFYGREYRYTAYGRPHCSACDTDHDVCQFPLAYQQPPGTQYRGAQLCLGQQGSVQLCEHVHIAWSSINAHIDDWRRRQKRGEAGEAGKAGREDNWQACLDNFKIECHDPGHDTRCTASSAPTWPLARLGTRSGLLSGDPDIVVLYLEWTPHGRIDALMPTADGRIPAPELRALFRRFRRMGPADTLYPPGRPEALTEMACFTPSFPIYYEMKEQEERDEDSENTPPPPPPPSFPPPFSNQRELSLQCQSAWGGSVGNSQRLNIRPHYLSGANNTRITSQCLIVSYQKAIMICETKALTDPAVKLVPSHHWLHAMDPRTYHHQQAEEFRPQCRDESCTNYYRRAKSYLVCG
ncbi:hypothetical protein LA080_007306 [Diaporthe eres]|uniref:F-box domain-containing protein n=1 Tax=Diaporthe vaccinii TaxID=105482 RepID=A0ABR4F5K5_9PEZI|nr:hypothetical protein LA080_007306 [Diaporthe eres]